MNAEARSQDKARALDYFVIRISCFLRHSSFGFRHFAYSYLSAVTGSRREAVHAGAKPEISPVNTDTSMLTRTSPDEK
jgi:hypothetical protein